jgi:hypothetical protein
MGDHMGTKATKIIMSILALSFMCLFLVACGEKKQPQYILMSAENNGLVESYRAYFELDGNNVQSMKEMRFDALIKDTSNYKLAEVKTYEYEVSATTAKPEDWKFTKEVTTEKQAFNRKTLIRYLRIMKLPYYGTIRIKVLDFDGYSVVEVWRMDGKTVLDNQSALFKSGHQVNTPANVSLKSLDRVYKKR